MKTFRMIGMALFAVLMCVNFAACSSSGDDEPEVNEEGIVTNEKKLVEMKEIFDDGSNIYTFAYDLNGRLRSITEKEFDSTNSQIYSYTWNENKFVEDDITYTIVDGLIGSGVSSFSSGCNYDFAYNSSKRITALQHYHSDRNDSAVRNFTWENGRIVKIVEEDEYGSCTWEFTYGKETCKGYCPAICGPVVDDDVRLFYVHPELVGARFNQLPSRIIRKDIEGDYTSVSTSEISYSFDSDGYVTKCRIKEMDEYETYAYSYTFKWE